ncbi:MAG: cyclic nucleotide-binding domain-containing protein [Desulfobacteraceae bacterium]|nr:cyclic nucleotide-binding domain-containing protein [Desulfobacteraceae bacterium]
MKLFSNYKRDLSGAVSAAIITLPVSIGYGLIAFAPLGLSFAPQAVLLGLYAAIIPGFFAALLGGNRIQITGPKPSLAFILAYAVSNFAGMVPEAMASREIIIVALASFCVCLGGIFQICFGVFRFGTLIKFVPYQVLAGFINGIAILMILGQMSFFTGMNTWLSFSEIFVWISSLKPLNFIVGLCSLLTIYLVKKYFKQMPASLMGLFVGVLIYYVLKFSLNDPGIGPVIGKIGYQLPAPKYFMEWFRVLNIIDLGLFLPQILITGITIGIIGSLESLMSSLISDNLLGVRHDSNRELIAQGVGNILGSFFGSSPSAGSTVRTLVNFRNGGRTKFSGMMCSFMIFLLILFASPLIGLIPRAVIAGIIIFVGWGLFDRETFGSIKQFIRRPFKQHKDVLMNLAVSIIVTIVMFWFNVITAVAIGIFLASGIFIVKMGNSIIRRRYTGEAKRSRKMRNSEHNEILDQKGKLIVVFELRGPLFFGSTDNLARTIEDVMENARYCIVDMKRVNGIDVTGVHILVQLKARLEKKNRHLLVSYLGNSSISQGFIRHSGIEEKLGAHCLFSDTDLALERAEDHLLTDGFKFSLLNKIISLDQLSLTRNFNEKQINLLRGKLIRCNFKKGEVIFLEGDKSRELYILLKGSVSIKIKVQEDNRLRRLITISPGVSFGEIALLDESFRSAGAWADRDSELLCLSNESFDQLCHHESEIAIKMLRNISLEFSRTLRRLTREIKDFEDH